MAPRDGLRALRAELGGFLPAELERLSPADALALAAIVRDSSERQAIALDEAVTRSLEAVPRAFRGPLRRILYG